MVDVGCLLGPAARGERRQQRLPEQARDPGRERQRVVADPEQQGNHDPADQVGGRTGSDDSGDRHDDREAGEHRPGVRIDAQCRRGHAQPERDEIEWRHGEGR